MDEVASDFDTAWKQAVEWFLEPFLSYFFPNVHEVVDWSRDYEFLDKELQKIMPEAMVGRGTVDLLVKVWLKDGTDCWLLIHVEVQSQQDSNFARRMYEYNHRLHDRYGRMPVSLAILGDDSKSWHPSQYHDGVLGCSVTFKFVTAKLLKYRGKKKALAQDPNPFAAVTLAHLTALETRGDPAARLAGKLSLVRSLYSKGLDRERIARLFLLIEWLLQLSHAQQRKFEEEVAVIEREQKVLPMTPTIRFLLKESIQESRAEGRAEGLAEGIEAILTLRFGDAGTELMPRIRQLTEPELGAFLKASKTAADLDSLIQLLPRQT